MSNREGQGNFEQAGEATGRVAGPLTDLGVVRQARESGRPQYAH